VDYTEGGVGLLELEPATQTPTPPRRAGVAGRVAGWLAGLIPLAAALGCVAGLVAVGRDTGWSLPRSAVGGATGPGSDDWCPEHGVPESVCVECDKYLLPQLRDHGWCRRHGVHDCPLDHPEVAQLPSVPAVTADDLERADRALAFAPRTENGKKCSLHTRRVQLASAGVADRLGIRTVAAARGPVTESVTAPAEVGTDPTRVARLAARVPGTVLRVERQVGDRVRAGDVLAVVEAAEVGRAKAEFQQALVQLDLKERAAEAVRAAGSGVVSGRAVREAEAAAEEARVRVLTAELTLANLGLPVRAVAVRGLPPADLARRLRSLGLPARTPAGPVAEAGSSNRIAVLAPFDGEVIARSAAAGEAADPATPLFVVADTSRLWLTLRVRLEDISRVAVGQAVRFRADGHPIEEAGTVAWVGPAADETTRTVPVRVALPNPAGRHRAGTFGTADIVLREEPHAVIVPASAVHWEGCCHVVFVRDERYDRPDAPKVFHVRTVRPGASAASAAGPMTEIIAGVLPGERVAAAGSGVLRSELLKNNLGEGCECCK
jgi:cobalt-zinc-cadmium efflux system membrane fusion protein